jgi:hypothetical protein
MIPWWVHSLILMLFFLLGWAIGAYQMYKVLRS